jgi:hypothetical protein
MGTECDTTVQATGIFHESRMQCGSTAARKQFPLILKRLQHIVNNYYCQKTPFFVQNPSLKMKMPVNVKV